MSSRKSKAIGIDLGTTYCCVAYYSNDKVEIISDDAGNRTTPSYVSFSKEGRLLGQSAKNNASKNLRSTVFSAKRFIGRNFNDISVQNDIRHMPFDVVNQNGKPVFRLEYKGEMKLFFPEEISAMVLVEMKTLAERRLKEVITDAVITVPAYFNDSQRRATKDAGRIAGLNVLRIINEPTAAAFAYGLNTRNDNIPSRNVLIFDLGGGTLDVSLVTTNNKDGVFDVKATSGNTHLGGEDFNNRLLGHLVHQVKQKTGRDVSSEPKALGRLRRACESTKKRLGVSEKVNIELEALLPGSDFTTTITRQEFEYLCQDLLNSILRPVKQVLADSGIDRSQVDEVVLVGGSTRIPIVRKKVSGFFGGKRPCQSINPDEAVAYGAAIQASILSGESVPNVILNDVAPLSLGVAIDDGKMSVLIPRNSRIPTSRKRCYTTITDFQEKVSVEVFEGESKQVINNNLLEVFDFKDYPRTKAGIPQIEVTFEIDPNSILHVSAVERTTGRMQRVLVRNERGRLSASVMDRMIADSDTYRREEEALTDRDRAKFEFESYNLSLIRKTDLAEISEEDKQQMRLHINRNKTWLESSGSSTATVNDFKEMKANLEQIASSLLFPPPPPYFTGGMTELKKN